MLTFWGLEVYVMIRGALYAVAFTAGLALTSGTALAADPSLETAFDWSGLYAGIQGGYAFGDARHSFDNGAPSGNSDPDGIFGGFHVGFNHQMNSILLGVEADAELADINGRFTDTSGIGSNGSTDIDMQASLRARLGLPIDRVMPYLTGGLAIADIDYGGGPVGDFCCGYSKSALGYTLGTGVEFAVTDSLTARVEYRYTDFGKESGALDPTFGFVRMTTDVQIHAIRAGLSLQF
jgi:outer membrane immunogenic protein